ncbi:MAG: exodeoxyribonuclease VII large subunit [Ignavibacteria bacterium]|nr:exodeoxyribonuclease VII large subunit [Ignavibacteria bacterium]
MENPVTISELTRDIKYLLENNFQFVYVTAEISNFKHHYASGHYYFTLKDEKAQISANMWNSRTRNLSFKPENGMKVLVKGRVTLYETRGTYQIDVFEMQIYGLGDLQAAFELLKQKLLAEGLFSAEHKKPLPLFPERVGIITSASGAALQDFLKVTEKRYPLVKLFLFDAVMQGAGSPESICRALELANDVRFDLDTIVITRGGGSAEDLWSFNDEKAARAIYNSRIPVVTAIGHEVDFTICDFVADHRAATPSAAAENIFPDKAELLKYINEAKSGLEGIVNNKLNHLKTALNNFAGNYYFKKPGDLLNEYRIRTDETEKKLEGKIASVFRNLKAQLFNYSNNYYFKKPADLISENKIRLDDMNKKFDEILRIRINNQKSFLDASEKLINSIGPEKTLKRGFTIIRKEGRVVSRMSSVKSEDEVEIEFFDGKSEAVIK